MSAGDANLVIGRAGDPMAIRVAAAAELSKKPLKITAMAESRKIAEDAIAPFSRKTLFLVLTDGSVLSEPNAMARYLYGCDKIDIICESRLEWEESVLRPAVYSGDSGAVQRLVTEELGSLVDGHPIDLADISIACTLKSALLLGMELSDDAKQYVGKVMETAEVLASLEKIGFGKVDDAISAQVVKSDVDEIDGNKIKLPKVGDRNILITSALPYVNNVPHLGNIIGCVLSADVYARFCRARGYNCIYVCGTDEYGTATETKAIEEGLSCQELCDKYNAIHKEIYDWFDIKFDKFGRTPTRYQTEIAQETFNQLRENGYLEEKTVEQLYSEPLQKFLADRYVTGTCPKCLYEDARGDQCDSCGSLLNPTELKNPKCAMSGSKPVLKSTRHVFLDLPRLSEDLQAYIDRSSKEGGWSSNCMHVTKAWLDQGLKSRCITRDLKWGTPVPLDGFRDKVFYVWFDAPIGYVSITATYCGDKWKAWWMPNEYFMDGESVPDVELVQFMGKDNVPFHTIIFPACQIGSQKPWTMMNSISVTEYLNYEDGKFSKSRGIGVFGNDAKETGIPVEVWRYYLLSMRPESQDSVFQWDDFAAKSNAELNDNLGNFINRTLKFIYARFDATVPGTANGNMDESVNKVLRDYGEKISEYVASYIQALESKKMKSALQSAMMISKSGNLFFQETEIWKVVKENRDTAAAYISTCFGTSAVLASLLEPFMPSLTAKILDQMNLDSCPSLTDDLIENCKSVGDIVAEGHKLVKEPVPIFKKITEEEVSELRARYAGSQASRVEGSKPSDAEQKQPESKKDKGKKEKKEAKGAKEELSSKMKKMSLSDKSVDISRIDIRVGKIVECKKHPDADSLYVETVDVGEEKPRTVVSGLVKFIPLEQMQNRRVVLVCNLKPANMRGIKSEAMVLAATAPDGNSVELVEPPASAEIGSRIHVEGYEGEADDILNPKKKVWEKVQVDLGTNDAKQACYKGVPFSGPCTVASIVNGSIK
ncbi:Methionine--tRNA ligase, cytoplasmic [Picochlorum sp. SENEW3]|nr:Methionine--tRNA ligase, cytoplasmic [Picochlorum sp. SENEW3]